MKELSIEEKAKRYDEAIKRVKFKIKNDKDHVLYGDDVIEIFPELKCSESESADEKVRKALIKLVTNHASMDLFIEYDIHLDEALSWLEKQGEKEINDNDIAVLENWENAVKENKEKWQLSDWFVEATSLLVRKVEYMGQGIKNDSNKTMLNACINALRNVGHQHLANWLEKQELKKIEDKIEIPFGAKDSELQEASYHIPKGFYAVLDGNKVIIKKGEQNTAWSEDDERTYRGLHNLIYSTPYCNSRKKLSDFLKSLKDRVQPKQEWAEEDEKCIRLSIDIIDSALRAGFCVQLDRDRCIDWLKSIKQRYTWKPSEEQIT